MLYLWYLAIWLCNLYQALTMTIDWIDWVRGLLLMCTLFTPSTILDRKQHLKCSFPHFQVSSIIQPIWYFGCLYAVNYSNKKDPGLTPIFASLHEYYNWHGIDLNCPLSQGVIYPCSQTGVVGLADVAKNPPNHLPLYHLGLNILLLILSVFIKYVHRAVTLFHIVHTFTIILSTIPSKLAIRVRMANLIVFITNH